MKHWITRFVSLVLTLCLLCPAALAQEADTLAEVEARFLFVYHDAIHALTYTGPLYRETGDGWLQVGTVYDDVWAVDSDGENVWLLSRKEDASGAWYEISRARFDEQGALIGTETPLEIVWDVNGDNWPQFYGLVVENSAAYVAVNGDDWGVRNLYRVDLSTGKATKVLSETLEKLIRYRDSLLLAARSTDDGSRVPEVIVINPADGSVEVIGTMNHTDDGGLVYDAETDAAYFSDNSYVYRVSGDAPEAVGYLALGGSDGRAAVIHQGRYCLSTYHGWVSATLDPELLPKQTLRIQNAWQLQNQVLAFARLHPEIAVEYAGGFYGGLEEFPGFMQSDRAPDVFTYRLDPEFITLRDRKYLTDLSASRTLMDTVARMAPNITRDILVDGRLYALPCSVSVSMNGYFDGGLEKAGLTAADVPTSYEGLLDFIERWYNDYFEENEGMNLFEYYSDMPNFLFDQIYRAQLQACQGDGVLTLDTPVFRRLLSRLEELKPILAEVAPPMEDEDWNDMADNALFTDMVTDLIREYPFDDLYGSHPMPLSLDEASEPTITAFLDMMILNPYSQNTEAAMTFLEYMAENLPITQRVAMMPEENDPIERSYYEEELQSLRDRAALMERLLASAPEESRADLEDELQYIRYQIEDYETNRWAMTADEVLWYRENIAPYLIFTTVDVYSSNTAAQLSHLRQRYLDGQATADEFIRRFEEIVWMKSNE